MDPITAALAAGAGAGLTGVATQAVKDAYGALKAALHSRFPKVGVNVQALEARPASDAKQTSLAEELEEAGAAHDAELLQLARALVEVIEREAPQAAASAGVDLERVRAEFVSIEGASGGTTGVRGRDWETRAGISIRDARGGRGPDPNS